MEHKDTFKKRKDKALEGFITTLENLYNRINSIQHTRNDEEQKFVESVLEAYEEWQNAEKFFHNVSDPDLVDHAIYKIEAAKSRYIYLLKKAKAKGFRMNLH